MRIVLFLVLIFFTATALPCHAENSSLPAPTSFSFSETFKGVDVPFSNGHSKLYPDPLKWAFTFQPGILWPDSYGDGTNWLGGNGESQTYVTPLLSKIKGATIPPSLRYDPFSIQEDGLHITADLLSPEQQMAYLVGGHRRFGSGMLLSRFAFQYGKIRVVAKLPDARGSWPAIWMLAEKFQWPPEIDILEGMAWGPHQTEMHLGVIPKKEDGRPFGRWYDTGADLSAGFHEYGLDWSEDTLIFLFDGQEILRKKTPDSMKHPMVLLINLAVGGNWVYNELNVLPIDDRSPERLMRGADLIEGDYPADMIIKSITIHPKD